MHVTYIMDGAENLTTVRSGMAEDKKDGNTGEGVEQFEVLDEVGDVEDWDGELPDEDKQDVEGEDAGKQVQSNEATASNDVKSKESSSSKDEKSKVSSTSKDKPSGKDGKSEDKKKTETKGSESRRKSTGSAAKRKSENREAQKPESKKMKLSSGKENKSLESVKEFEVISPDSWKEHQIRKKRFVDAMIMQSEELKRERDYRRWVEKERKDGMVFPVFDIDPPAEPIIFSRCKIVSGYANDSTTLCLGFVRDDEVLKFSACDAKYVPAVRNTVKAFEEMVRSCSKPMFDPITRQGYWHGVEVTTNSKGETLLKVDLHAADEQEGEVRFAEAKDIMVNYFSSEGPGLDCHVSSLYLRLVFAKKNRGRENVSSERTTARCIMGDKFIVETISGIKVNLYPWSFFSTGTLAMTALCEEMLKVLLRERCKTVVELGCGTGIVGQFLAAKHCECMLGVDTAECITEAKVNADENNLKNCTYFDGKKKDIWKTIDDALRGKSSVLVIVNALNYDYLVEGPVISWLTRSSKVCRVVYIKRLKTPKSRVAIVCKPTRQPKKHRNDPMPYFPLYALPVVLGDKFFAAVLVLQHVESNFVNELYERREKYTVKCICIANSTSGLRMVEDDPREKTKHHSTSSSAKKNVSSKPNDNNAHGNTTDVKNVAGIRTRTRRRPARRTVDSDRARVSRREDLGSSRNVRVNKDDTLTRRIGASRHDGILPPRDLRNTLQSRPGHNHMGGLLGKLIQDLRTVLQGKKMYAERRMNAADGFRKERFVDEIIRNRNRNLLHPSFVHGVVPPRNEDLRQVLQEKVMVENIARDRNERSGKFYGRGQVRGYENSDMRSFVEGNRATLKNEGKDSFREPSRLPRDTGTWGGAGMRMSFKDELSSGRDLYRPGVWGKLHSRNNEPEAFPLVKDSALFERGLDSKMNVGDERRKGMLANIQDIRSIDAHLHGPGPGRSFDDSALGGRKPRTDNIASGIKTDVRGINIRAGGWNARNDIRNMESIRDSFSKFDAYLSNVKSGVKDFQHSWGPDDRNRNIFVRAEDRKLQMFGEPDDRKRSLHGEPVDSKRLKYGVQEDKRSVYGEPGDRKRSLFGGPEYGSGYMFSKTDDRNVTVTERSRPVVEVGRSRPVVEVGRSRPVVEVGRSRPVVEVGRSRPVVEVGRNRPTVKEIGRNRLMPGEREREKVLFGGRADIYRTGY